MQKSKGWFDRYIDYQSNKMTHWAALEAFNSLMQANQCYSVNPYGPFKPDWSDDLEIWQEAEANTGPHLILKKL